MMQYQKQFSMMRYQKS